MPYVFADRVKETFTGTGPGNITVGGAAPGGFATFAARIGVGNTADVCALDPVTGEWEVFATQLLSATVLQRGTLRASSTGSRVSFAGGVKEVFAVLPAAEAMLRSVVEAALALRLQDAPVDGLAYVREGAVWAAIPRRPTFVTVSGGTHAPALGVDGRWFVCTNAGGCVVTIPTNAAVAFPIGTPLTYEQDAAGSITFPEAGGVVIKKSASFLRETAEQGAVVQVVKRATDTWVLYGNLKAA